MPYGDSADLQRRLELRRRAWLIRDAAANLVQEHKSKDSHRLRSMIDGIHTGLQHIDAIKGEWTDPAKSK